MVIINQKAYCINCKNKTNFKILQEYKTKSDHNDEIQWKKNYYIIQCLGCDSIAFQVEYGDEDQWEHDKDDNRIWYSDYKVYPEEPKKDVEITKKFNLDAKHFVEVTGYIYDIYSEVIWAYNSSSFFIAALGLRTIVEAICKDCNIKDGFILDENSQIIAKEGKTVRSRKLNGLINGLVEKGYITSKQSRVLHQVRELGNSTTHDISMPKEGTIFMQSMLLK